MATVNFLVTDNFSKYLILCLAEEKNSYRFGTTWIFGWTIPLRWAVHHKTIIISEKVLLSFIYFLLNTSTTMRSNLHRNVKATFITLNSCCVGMNGSQTSEEIYQSISETACLVLDWHNIFEKKNKREKESSSNTTTHWYISVPTQISE